METLTFEGRITAKAPIFTGGDDKTGVEQLLRRIDFIVDGERIEVPIISGNSIRGVLRRMALQDFFDRLGYAIKSLRVYYLFSGGALEQVSQSKSGTLDLQLRRMIRNYIPPLSLFGGSISNQAFAGKITVGKALPICTELDEYLPVKGKNSFYEFLTHTFSTRHAEREVPASVEKPKKQEPTIQMKVNLECFAPGTTFYHKFQLLDTTNVEKSCFAHILDLWMQRPFLGGRAATGYGEVSLNYPTLEFTPERYLEFLDAEKKQIVKTLGSLEKL